MKRKLMFVLLMSGVILSPMGAYAMNDEGGVPRTSISRSYRVPVTVLPSGDVELPSGTILSPKATVADALKAMTQKDKELGQELEHKPLQPGTTYFSIYNNAFISTKHHGLYPGFFPLNSALETIEGSTQQPGASPHVGGSSSTPSAAPALRPELETAD
ncbi:hypothetical protein QPK87_03230 [Kamptonema cortianum]|jgi:hypothetical protein|nr:hypothetical protein [Geitlerinema splendidum]MDK3155596.1 hypothetical protein [Kamptonema cortianum]